MQSGSQDDNSTASCTSQENRSKLKRRLTFESEDEEIAAMALVQIRKRMRGEEKRE